MRSKVIFHTIILLSVTCVTFFWVTHELLSKYSLQLTGVLLLTLLICHRLIKGPSFKLIESTISTIGVLLVTSATGGITSPLFFLTFFLLFELSLLLEPVIPLILSFAFIFFFFITAEVGISGFQWLALLAFPYMTPLAVIFGNIYQKVKNQKKEIRSLSHQVENLKEELVEEELRINTSVR